MIPQAIIAKESLKLVKPILWIGAGTVALLAITGSVRKGKRSSVEEKALTAGSEEAKAKDLERGITGSGASWIDKTLIFSTHQAIQSRRELAKVYAAYKKLTGRQFAYDLSREYYWSAADAARLQNIISTLDGIGHLNLVS